MIFIVSGRGPVAKIIRDLEKRLIVLLNGYQLEKMSKGENENLFFKRILKKEND